MTCRAHTARVNHQRQGDQLRSLLRTSPSDVFRAAPLLRVDVLGGSGAPSDLTAPSSPSFRIRILPKSLLSLTHRVDPSEVVGFLALGRLLAVGSGRAPDLHNEVNTEAL
eukprot:5623659-Amphidinium_carterae.1